MRTKGSHKLTRDQVLGIYLSAAKPKKIAHEFGVSQATISHIKTGNRHRDLTDQWRKAAVINAHLVSLACTGRPA